MATHRINSTVGMNAYFTYSVVGFRGTGNVSWQAASTAVMIEGAIFLVLALTGLRYRLIKIIPEPVRIATPAGIGAVSNFDYECLLTHCSDSSSCTDT